MSAANTENGSVVATTGTHSGAGSNARAASNRSLGLFNEPVRSLMHSDKMAKVDYARLRVNTQCLAFTSGAMAANLVENSIEAEAKVSDTDKLLFGRASTATRRAALSRSIDACSKLFEGSQITADEMTAFNAQPNTAKWRRLLKAGQKENFGTDFAATNEFFEKMVSEPMLGAIEALLCCPHQ